MSEPDIRYDAQQLLAEIARRDPSTPLHSTDILWYARVLRESLGVGDSVRLPAPEGDRLAEIRAALVEYDAHKDDAYAYSEGEIAAVRAGTREQVIATISRELDDWKDAGAPTAPMVRWILALLESYAGARPVVSEPSEAAIDAADAFQGGADGYEAIRGMLRAAYAVDFGASPGEQP